MEKLNQRQISCRDGAEQGEKEFAVSFSNLENVLIRNAEKVQIGKRKVEKERRRPSG